jgi:hypothetical protein
MKISLENKQKDKLADFFITVSTAWFVAAIIAPFVEVSQLPIVIIFVSLMNSGLYLWLGLFVVRRS